MIFENDSGVRCFWQERGAGPPLLMIHGLGSSGADWAFQVAPLMEEFRVILPDLPGSGRSGKPAGPYSISGFAAGLWQLLDSIEVGRIDLVGFSLGGAVALEMALQRPEAVGRMVLINSLPSYRVDHWKKWLELYLQIGMVRTLGLPRAAGMIGARLFPLPHQAAMRKRVSDVVGANPVTPYLASARALASWCADARVPALQARTLMIAGEFDYTPLAEKARWAERLGAELAVVKGSRHGTPFDSIAATNRCLRHFLTGGAVGDLAPLTIDAADDAPLAAPLSLD